MPPPFVRRITLVSWHGSRLTSGVTVSCYLRSYHVSDEQDNRNRDDPEEPYDPPAVSDNLSIRALPEGDHVLPPAAVPLACLGAPAHVLYSESLTNFFFP